jgi:hypothetical protein
VADDLGTVLAVPVDHDPWAVPKPGQTVPPTMDPISAMRAAAGDVLQQARPYWMDLDPTDREIAERQDAMQRGISQPGKVLPTTGMNPVPFAALDIGSMLPVGGAAKLAAGMLGIGAKRALAGAAEAGTGAAERAAQEAAQGIRAYHSSPHDFTQFDLSKIGTGEGAQAYGHGIYVAENPAVSGAGGEYWRAFARQMQQEGQSPEMTHAIQVLEGAGGDRAQAIAKLDEVLRSNVPTAYPREKIQATRDLLASDQQVGPRTYEVNIGARPEQFLDWDKPFSQQPKTVRDLFGYFEPYPSPTGEEIYQHLGRGADKAAATQKLMDAGIPGIRYLDQGSRSKAYMVQPTYKGEPYRDPVHFDNPHSAEQWAQEQRDKGFGADVKDTGSRNYVVFDPKMIEIMRKYGIAGLLGGGAASQLPQYPLPFQPGR